MEPPQSLWWSSLTRPVIARPALQRHLDVDVAIVGGGFTGLWTARELKRRDPSLRIAVLEKSVCGFGASGRNGGWASGLFPVGEEHVIASYGEDALAHLQRVLWDSVGRLGRSMAEDGIDADFEHGGTLTFARSEIQRQRLMDGVATSRGHGVGPDDLEWLEGNVVRERGFVEGALGAKYSPHCARIHQIGRASCRERVYGRV